MNSKIDAFDRAAGYLAMQPRTEKEIRDYLKKKEYSESEIDDGIKKLLEYRYLDDAAYACSFIRRAADRGWGRRKMERELTAKGVSRENLEAAWNRLSEEDSAEADRLFDEKKRALEIAVRMTRQHLSEHKMLDDKFFARVGRRLTGQGYCTDTVCFVINKLRGLKR